MQMSSQLSFTIDEPDGIVHVVGVGMWSPEYVVEHFRDLDRALERIRREQGFARVFVDLRAAAVQATQTTQVLGEWTGRVYRDSDRAAVLCASALLAMQIKRAADVRLLATFHEMAPALAWLRQDATGRLSA
ncbi:MAG: hypothetical protein ABS86_02480 [Sphingobium sp. SCN 64-10]|nr:MAG: hypothetical protein ABS86_02480 [Sphingobium sp. SCN 64-10]